MFVLNTLTATLSLLAISASLTDARPFDLAKRLISGATGKSTTLFWSFPSYWNLDCKQNCWSPAVIGPWTDYTSASPPPNGQLMSHGRSCVFYWRDSKMDKTTQANGIVGSLICQTPSGEQAWGNNGNISCIAPTGANTTYGIPYPTLADKCNGTVNRPPNQPLPTAMAICPF